MINIAEVVSFFIRNNMPLSDERSLADRLGLDHVEADWDIAIQAGNMIGQTKPFGLSLGDRFCLATAARLNIPVMTSDRSWAQAVPAIGVGVTLIR